VPSGHDRRVAATPPTSRTRYLNTPAISDACTQLLPKLGGSSLSPRSAVLGESHGYGLRGVSSQTTRPPRRRDPTSRLGAGPTRCEAGGILRRWWPSWRIAGSRLTGYGVDAHCGDIREPWRGRGSPHQGARSGSADQVGHADVVTRRDTSVPHLLAAGRGRKHLSPSSASMPSSPSSV
jgi:hypothetical protein